MADGPLTWKNFIGGFVVDKPGSAAEYQTGGWRSQKPVWDNTKCIKCGVCYIYCPEPCIRQTAEGYFESDLFYCKGCGICARECWTNAIKMVQEEEV